jgi:hypothetical protein
MSKDLKYFPTLAAVAVLFVPVALQSERTSESQRIQAPKGEAVQVQTVQIADALQGAGLTSSTLLGAGPLLGEGLLQGSGPLVGAGPLQGAPPLIAGGVVGAAGPVISLLDDRNPPPAPLRLTALTPAALQNPPSSPAEPGITTTVTTPSPPPTTRTPVASNPPSSPPIITPPVTTPPGYLPVTPDPPPVTNYSRVISGN